MTLVWLRKYTSCLYWNNCFIDVDSESNDDELPSLDPHVQHSKSQHSNIQKGMTTNCQVVRDQDIATCYITYYISGQTALNWGRSHSTHICLFLQYLFCEKLEMWVFFSERKNCSSYIVLNLLNLWFMKQWMNDRLSLFT